MLMLCGPLYVDIMWDFVCCSCVVCCMLTLCGMLYADVMRGVVC